MNLRCIAPSLVVLSALGASTALAQSATPNGLAGLLLNFFSPSNPVILEDNPVPAFSHAAHFVSQPGAQATLRQINRGVASQISTFPLGSSAASFTYEFDPALGVYNRSTESFGPVFGERAITAGKGKFSFGVNYLDATYDKFEGLNLNGNDIQLYLVHKDTNGDGSSLTPWFEGDIIRADLSIDLEQQTTAVVANYGITDRLDVGVAIPFQHLRLDARINATIEHLATQPDPFTVHQFPNGQGDNSEFRESGTATGIGDIVVRAKWNFLKGGSSGMAATLDLRLPTGNADDLLGSGATQVKLALVAAKHAGRFAPRASAGYTFSSGGADFLGDLPNELNYSGGFDAVLHRRVTLTADFLGRTLFNVERLVLVQQDFQFDQQTDPTVRDVQRLTPGSATSNMNLLLASAGLKYNPVGHLLVVGNVLFGVGNDGLQDKVTPSFGLEYSF
jgi:hypothetical protein